MIGDFAFVAHLRAAQRVRQAPQPRLHGGQGEGQQGIASLGVVMRDPIIHLTSNRVQGERRPCRSTVLLYRCSINTERAPEGAQALACSAVRRSLASLMTSCL